jgi:hypothetical protein
MRARALPLLLLALALPSAALAHHIDGTLYCDVNWNGVIDGPDTPLNNYTAKVVSQTVSPGETFTDASDSSGYYYIGLPARTDDYLVSLSGLPGGQAVVVPASGSWSIHIVTGNSQLDHADNVNFLVQGCAPQPTTTTTSTTTTTTHTTTTTSTTSTTTQPTTTSTTSTSSTTTTSASSTTTTTLGQSTCGCAAPNFAFLARRFLKVNNDGSVGANIGVNDPKGFLRLSRNLDMPDGTLAAADRVELGDGASIWAVDANTFKKAIGAVVRSGNPGTPTLPLTSPFCPISTFGTACTGPDVLVQLGETRTLPPGVYGKLKVLDGGTLHLDAGTYTFCDAKTGQGTAITTEGAAGTLIQVGQRLQLGDGSVLGPQSSGDPIPVVHVEGKKFRLGEGAEATMYLSAPSTKLTMGRDSMIHGTLCVDFMKTDKHTTLDCPCGQ